MKDSIGEKQVKVYIMKKFLIVIFAMFGLMVGMFALMLSGYYEAYEKAHNRSSYSGPRETYPVEKYSSSSSSKKYYDYKNYSTSSSSTDASSSTKYYDYKK